MCHGRVKRQPSKVLGATTELGLLGGWGDSRGELISQETRHRDNDNARPCSCRDGGAVHQPRSQSRMCMLRPRVVRVVADCRRVPRLCQN